MEYVVEYPLLFFGTVRIGRLSCDLRMDKDGSVPRCVECHVGQRGRCEAPALSSIDKKGTRHCIVVHRTRTPEGRWSGTWCERFVKFLFLCFCVSFLFRFWFVFFCCLVLFVSFFFFQKMCSCFCCLWQTEKKSEFLCVKLITERNWDTFCVFRFFCSLSSFSIF